LKPLETIFKQKPVFLHNWSNKFEVIRDFEGIFDSDDELQYRRINQLLYDDVNILFASYVSQECIGDSWVLFEKNGTLYEINGSHYSSEGLIDQWEPEEITLEELEHRVVNGTFGADSEVENRFREELCKFIGIKHA